MDNGLALCSMHHVAFDYGAISPSQELGVLVSQNPRGEVHLVKDGILACNGLPLRLPQGKVNEPWHDYTKWHRRNVFKGHSIGGW